MDRAKITPMMIAKLNEDGHVLIASVLTDPGDHVELTLPPGEVFGGRSYDEWRTVAEGAGSVSADWLSV